MKFRFSPHHPLTTVLGILTLLYLGVSAHAQSGGPLVVQPKRLVFSTVAGAPSTTVQCLRVVATDSTITSWNASADQPWLALSAASGATPGTNNISINALQSANLLPGVYDATITITGGGSPGSQTAQVTLIVNPSEGPRLSPWKDGRRGACSISVDDSLPSGYEFLQQAGLRATYFLNGTAAPAYFSGFYQSGMEIGSHLVNHFCKEMDEATLRGNIEPSISGLSYSTLTPVNEFVGLAWPCGVYTITEQVLSSEYFLSARGYGINQLEDTTPADFMNLKSFNSHEHNAPGDDRNLKDVVDAAEAGGKWANLVFHAELNDDGAVGHLLTKDLWVAPIGDVVNYILLRDRTIVSGYTESDSSIEFSFRRIALNLPRRFPGDLAPSSTFETAIGPDDLVTLELDITDLSSGISQVTVDGVDYPYSIRTDGGVKKLYLNVQPGMTAQKVVLLLSPEPSAVLGPLPANLVFSARQGTDPAEQELHVSNTGSGTMEWMASVVDTDFPWLEVTPSNGRGNGTVTVRVNTIDLPPGTHTGRILVESVGAANSPQEVEVTLTVIEEGAQHFDFTYPNQASLVAPATGWSFVGRRPGGGGARDTEVNSPNVAVSYNATTRPGHPGVLRIPAVSGQLYGPDNNSVNTLFRDLPANWNSLRLKMEFKTSQPFDQVSLAAYQDDDNYVGVTRVFDPRLVPLPGTVLTYYVNNLVEVLQEDRGAPSILNAMPFPASTFFLRLDRVDDTTISAFYSVDGEAWLPVATVAHNLVSPKLGVVVGGPYSVGGDFLTPSLADLQWVEVISTLPERFLRVTSLNPDTGASVKVNRRDRNGASDGTTEFTRSYASGTEVKLTATPVAGRSFSQWRQDGGQIVSQNPTVKVVMDTDHTLTAVYETIVVHQLTVASAPDSGASVEASPADNGGFRGGSTQFTLAYNKGTTVTLTAPPTYLGKNFQKWQEGGRDLGTSPILDVTMMSDRSLTAVYVAPRIIQTLAIESVNPDSGVSVTVTPADINRADNGVTRFTRSYDNGTVVTLSAPSAAGGNLFQKWQKDGADFSLSPTVQVPLDSDHTLTAVYVTPSLRTLTVKSLNPDRWVLIGVTPPDNDGDRSGLTTFTRSYRTGTVVTLTSPPTYFGRTFQKWQKDGADYSTSPSIQVTMENDHTLAAVYMATPVVRTLTVSSSNPNRGIAMTVSPADNAGKSGGSTQFALAYNNGTVVTLTAPLLFEGKSFQKWQKDGRDISRNSTIDVTMDANHTVNAVYVDPPPRTLTVASYNPSTGVAVTLSAADLYGRRDGTTKFTRSYRNGTTLTLTAPATAGGNVFQKWQKDGVDLEGGRTVTVVQDADHTLTAIYTRAPVLAKLTVASANPGSGIGITVSPSDNNGKRDGLTLFTRSYLKGTVVTLTAPGSAGLNTFQKWQKDGVDFSTNPSIRVTLDADHALTAVYVLPRITRTLTVGSFNPISGIGIALNPPDNNGKSGGPTTFIRSFDNRTTVTLTAPATAGLNTFKKWQKDGLDFGTSQTVQVLMDADHTLTAIYASPASVPSPWATQNVGATAANGSASYNNGLFTVQGSGSDIWNASDEFRYVYQAASGDCTIVARVKAVQNTNPWAKAGIMIRDSLLSNAKHASVFVTPANGVAFQWRGATGWSSDNVNTTGLAAPYWVKITRVGSTFTAYRSSNGYTWTLIGSQRIFMGSSVHIGLAVTSHNDGMVCTASFDNITVNP